MSLKKINQSFAPFCHGTSTHLAKQIDAAKALEPREQRTAIYGGVSKPSNPDRVYFGSVSHPENGWRVCTKAMMDNTEAHGEVPWKDGAIYVLPSIPKAFAEKLVRDEDCQTCPDRDAYGSLRKKRTFAIKGTIPTRATVKMIPREFYTFVKQYDRDLEPWRDFVLEELGGRDPSFFDRFIDDIETNAGEYYPPAFWNQQ